MRISTGSKRPALDEWLTPRRFALLLLGLLIVSFPQVIFGLQTFVFRDFGIFSYPLAFHFRECFWHGEVPLWNPLNCCGVPFLAQWNTQVLYPPALFYILLPLSWALGVFCLLHLCWGGAGMYILAERWTKNRLAAAFAGIVFAFSGLMLSSLIWPSTIAGLAWMPWVVWGTERAWREGGRLVLLAAVMGALQMLSGGVEAVMLTWVLLGGLWLADFYCCEVSRGKMMLRAGLAVLLITGLSAIQLLPFFELLDYSRRQQSISAATSPMPITGWANFLAPLFHCRSFQGVFNAVNQKWINSYYVGAATVALAVGALRQLRCERRIVPMAVLTVLCLILALGEATPVYTWLAGHFNMVGLMRFPVKFVILPEFALPLLGAFALAKLSVGQEKPIKLWFAGGIYLVMVAAILTLTFLPGGPTISAKEHSEIIFNGLIRVFYLTAIMTVWFAARKFRKPSLRWWQALFLLLVWMDLLQQIPLPHTVDRAVYEPGLARHWTAPQYGRSRAQLPTAMYNMYYHSVLPDATTDYLGRRYGLMADCNLLENVPKCDGFYPLYLSRYAALFYNFYKDEEPAKPLLDFLGVSEVLEKEGGSIEWQPRSTFLPLLTAGQRSQFADELAALEQLTNADFDPQREVILPTAAKLFVVVTNFTNVRLSSVTYSDQRIEAQIEAAEPTMVVAAQTFYPEWHAYVDGVAVKLWPANYAFQAFEVPAGTHRIELAYEDGRFRAGLVISLISMSLCVTGYVLTRKRKTG